MTGQYTPVGDGREHHYKSSALQVEASQVEQKEYAVRRP